MILAAKYGCFFIFFAVSAVLTAQEAIVPTKLSASYKKYPNRIELIWQATAPNSKYIIQRREQHQKKFTAIDTVVQNRYVDRNNLRANMDYFYCVQSVLQNGAVSLPSEEAAGALMGVAGGKNDHKDSLHIQDCLHLNITEAKTRNQVFVVKFLANATCSMPNTAQLTLYYSPDAAWDSSDIFLTQQSFDLFRKRGAMTAKNEAKITNGYLILKVSANETSFTVAQKIE
jgi:hypothetical protein